MKCPARVVAGLKSTLTGETKAKAEKEIDEVTKQHEALEEKMMQVEGSTEEKFLDLKNSLKGEFEEATAESKEKEGACDQAPAAGLARPTHCKQQPCTFG